MKMRVPDNGRDLITLCKRKGKYFWEFDTKHIIPTDTVIEIIDNMRKEHYGTPDMPNDYEYACKDILGAIMKLKGGELE